MTPTTRHHVANQLRLMRRAYAQLADGANTLLTDAHLFWTDRLLLRLVRHPYRRRLQQMGAVLPAVNGGDDDTALLKESMLEAQVEAALQGNDLRPWEETDDDRGYQATCSKCGGSVYVSGGVLEEVRGGGGDQNPNSGDLIPDIGGEP